MNGIKGLALSLLSAGMLFLNIHSNGVIKLNAAHAVEDMTKICDYWCQEEIERQDRLWREYQTLYDKHFGAGAFAGIDLTYVNTTLLRAQIEAKCIQNSDNTFADCQSELNNMITAAGSVCSYLASYLGPLVGTVTAFGCIASTYYVTAEVPALCDQMKANARADNCML